MPQAGFGADRKKVAAGVSLVSLGLSFFIWMLGWLDPWEAKTWDIRARMMAAPGSATPDICLVLVDQESLDWGKSVNEWPWPWPREVFGAIIRFLGRSGARAVVVDILFTEPSRFGVQDDEALDQAIAETRGTVLAMVLGKETGSHSRWPEGIAPPKWTIRGLDDWLEGPRALDIRFPKALFPLEEVGGRSDMLGNVAVMPEIDGVYRTIRFFDLFDENPTPTLGLAAYLAAHPESSASVSPGEFTVDAFRIPIDDTGRAVLRFRGPAGTHVRYSAAAVIQSEIMAMEGASPTIPFDAFRDKYVLIGLSAPGLYDLRPSPMKGSYSGAEIHATVLDNLLSGDFIRRFPSGAAWTLIAGWVFLVSAALAVFKRLFTVCAAAAAGLLLPAGVAYAAYRVGYWFPFMAAETAVVAAVGISFASLYHLEGRQKKFIKNAFRQYLNPDVIEQLIASPDRLKLGGEERVLSIFFSDLESFTAISELLEPKKLTELLNRYLTAMTNLITQSGGTVDKYEGDAIIAFWNAPLAVDRHPEKCVRTALECQKRLMELRPAIQRDFGHILKMRIGVNTGRAVVGNFGSDTKFDYTMIGDNVNLAARLEGANKMFGTYTMISEFTAGALNGALPVRELGRVQVVGRKHPVTVFEPFLPDDFASRRDLVNRFEEGVKHFYEGRFDAAAACFAPIADQDPPAGAYLAKCRELSGTVITDWQGVWGMTRK